MLKRNVATNSSRLLCQCCWSDRQWRWLKSIILIRVVRFIGIAVTPEDLFRPSGLGSAISPTWVKPKKKLRRERKSPFVRENSDWIKTTPTISCFVLCLDGPFLSTPDKKKGLIFFFIQIFLNHFINTNLYCNKNVENKIFV